MTITQRRMLWGGTAIIGIGIIGLSVWLGFEKASMLGSVVGAIFGLIAAAIGFHQLFSARGINAQSGPTRQSQQSGASSVNIQAGSDLTIGNDNRFGSP
ncbi:hypothetical protein [Streptomyces nymphaeiformis]|uniref:Putative membrane protein n=1 Tax=Streptomyces nymphaeiformis TaxID=2663842 RepID=A0A7W7XBF8_9ACTN|nr:hypothetical protein [Streptomyces nymphaeiformis]MBB4982519.1 putative membrane protein [Streptomyces nymphaeiformis]